LETFPKLAVARDQLRSGYRSFPVGEYLILYRIKEPGVQIMHIVHSRRDLETLFGQ
jgi:toxin ParE1/3/4